MGEVSRLLFASPGLRPMETFLLILLSILIGFDAPYFFYFHYCYVTQNSFVRIIGISI